MSASFFAGRCGVHDAAREDALRKVGREIDARKLELVRMVWCDVHGITRGKSLVAGQAVKAMRDGVGMVGTLMLKDSSDRTAYKVFDPAQMASLPSFAGASNLMLLGDPASLRVLPWAHATGWVLGQAWYQDGQPVELDSRRVLQRALEKLAARGWGMKCGLEVEFHIYRIDDTRAQLDPVQAAWPGLPPQVSMVHPGYYLLTEHCLDLSEEPLRIVQHTAQALGLPLHSLEIELGPSQVEAVFEVTDALTAADNMVLFRNGVRQALRQAGYHATFMCRPPFPNIMSSGWHLHQSVVELATGANLFRRERPAEGVDALDARQVLSDVGAQWLAGLLAHARGASVFSTPSVNGYGRFKPNALAPQSALWGRDNRGAMLRLVGHCADAATRIENRVGEPTANPYLYMASQIHAGLDGIERGLQAPPGTETPYAAADQMLPTSLGEALSALQEDRLLIDAFGPNFVDYLVHLKRSEQQRFDDAQDKDDFQRREYFSRV